MRDAIAVLDQATDLSLVAVTERSLAAWRLLLERSGQRAGCAVLAVAVDTDSPELRNRTAAAFRAWRLRLAEMLVTGGLESAPAARWAATLVTAAEGAVMRPGPSAAWSRSIWSKNSCWTAPAGLVCSPGRVGTEERELPFQRIRYHPVRATRLWRLQVFSRPGRALEDARDDHRRIVR